MKLRFFPEAWTDYDRWKADDPETAARIRALLTDIRLHPFEGVGKPEPLKGSLSGWWSRRITLNHRLVYRVEGAGEDQVLFILKCRHHY